MLRDGVRVAEEVWGRQFHLQLDLLDIVAHWKSTVAGTSRALGLFLPAVEAAGT